MGKLPVPHTSLSFSLPRLLSRLCRAIVSSSRLEREYHTLEVLPESRIATWLSR